MPRQKVLLTLVALLLAASPAAGQRVSTRCHVVDAPIDETTTDLRLVGCSEHHQDNVLWHLDRADSLSGELDGWFSRQFTGRGAVVYVLDSGIRIDHDEFVRSEGTNVLAGLDVVRAAGYTPRCTTGTHLPLDPCRDTSPVSALWLNTHGTATASLIGGRTTGIAPDAILISVLIEPRPDTATFNLTALDTIIRHAWEPSTPPFRTAIVNLSLAVFRPGDSRIAAFEQKMRQMIGGVDAEGNPDPAGKRFLFVGIAGNYDSEPSGPSGAELYGFCDANRRAVTFPASRGVAIDGLIVVGGITRENRIWERSCVGPDVDVLAPATDMFVASVTGRDHYRSGYPVEGYPANAGTSYAAPYVSGLAALLLEQNPTLTPEQLESIIKSSPSRAFADGDTTAGGVVAVAQTLANRPRRRAVSR